MVSSNLPILICGFMAVTDVCGVTYMVGFMDLGMRDPKQIMQSHILVSSYSTTKLNYSMPWLSQTIKNRGKKHFKFVMDPRKERATKYDCTEKKGVLIQSEKDICVHGISVDRFSVGGFHAFPLTEDATEFYVSLYSLGPHSAGQILLASNSNNNRITISKKRDEGYETRKVVRIDKFDLYQFKSWGTDLTGTYISSAEPIAVFSGIDCSQVPVNVGFCDNMMAGVPPLKQLGTRYIVAPLADRANTTGYVVRVVATRDNTYITNNDMNKTLDRGQYWEIDTRNSTLMMDIKCSHPCMVVQFGKGSKVDFRQWDPFMMVVTPLRHYANKAIWTNPVDRHGLTLISYANIVVPYGYEDGVLIDSKNITSEWNTPPGAQFSYTQVRKYHGAHTVRHTNKSVKIGVMAYGRGTTESTAFGYPACPVPAKEKDDDDDPSSGSLVAGASCGLSSDRLHPLWLVLCVLAGIVVGLAIILFYVWRRVRQLKGVPSYIFNPCARTGAYTVRRS